ncbi:hypothetical protein GCM10022255_088980 [Dactylosporangium darangshiense]|uniref:Tyr recombinase domain-containing protein n=1 Tax=Dactylosporangium darangshiense TaxID=579108 RepID=A0ABP8DNI2_9ACTN
MITSGVPLAVVSKTLRHSTLSVTVNIYGHLTRQAAHDAVEATAAAATPTQPRVGSRAGPAAPWQQSRTARPSSDHAPDSYSPEHRRRTERTHQRAGSTRNDHAVRDHPATTSARNANSGHAMKDISAGHNRRDSGI